MREEVKKSPHSPGRIVCRLVAAWCCVTAFRLVRNPAFASLAYGQDVNRNLLGAAIFLLFMLFSGLAQLLRRTDLQTDSWFLLGGATVCVGVWLGNAPTGENQYDVLFLLAVSLAYCLFVLYALHENRALLDRVRIPRGLAVVLAVEALVKAFRPWAGPSASWTAAVAVVAALAVVLFFVTFSTTRERVRPVRAERHPVLLSLRDLLHNRPWLILAGAAVCLQVFNAFRESGTIYFFKYCVAGETVGTVSFAGIALTGSALFLAVGPFFNIAGIVLIPFAADRFGRRRTLVGTLLLTAVFSFAFYFVRQGGYSVLLLAQALISLSVGGVLPLLWAMSADTADYAERRSGRRDTGLIFSSYSMAQKMGWAVGSAATAWILSLAGFEANAVQSPAALTVIGCLQSVFPALAALGTCAFILFYPLADSRPK